MTARKTIFLLDINGFSPEIKKLTLPFIKCWAEKINADIHWITERKFPDWPVTYEKLQIYELAQKIGGDWFIYLDLDTLIHPECLDFTAHLQKDTIAEYSKDVASIRWKIDPVFLRDGRFIGAGNWFTVASDWCIDLWRPLEDLSPEEALANIRPTPNELNHGITAEHLIDDYALSRNIARYGLKYKSFLQIWSEQGLNFQFLQHQYTITAEEKVKVLDEYIKKKELTPILEKWS
jgi:hypothetical protein